jgi:hypothetical protein
MMMMKKARTVHDTSGLVLNVPRVSSSSGCLAQPCDDRPVGVPRTFGISDGGKKRALGLVTR